MSLFSKPLRGVFSFLKNSFQPFLHESLVPWKGLSRASLVFFLLVGFYFVSVRLFLIILPQRPLLNSLIIESEEALPSLQIIYQVREGETLELPPAVHKTKKGYRYEALFNWFSGEKGEGFFIGGFAENQHVRLFFGKKYGLFPQAFKLMPVSFESFGEKIFVPAEGREKFLKQMVNLFRVLLDIVLVILFFLLARRDGDKIFVLIVGVFLFCSDALFRIFFASPRMWWAMGLMYAASLLDGGIALVILGWLYQKMKHGGFSVFQRIFAGIALSLFLLGSNAFSFRYGVRYLVFDGDWAWRGLGLSQRARWELAYSYYGTLYPYMEFVRAVVAENEGFGFIGLTAMYGNKSLWRRFVYPRTAHILPKDISDEAAFLSYCKKTGIRYVGVLKKGMDYYDPSKVWPLFSVKARGVWLYDRETKKISFQGGNYYPERVMNTNVWAIIELEEKL
ncbi:hypothetical protein [Thermospira aquatica]|uniref:Uncharacterized protein n=1 Tax=Thermospira aquatica TaxID=2828656 RepID=A0AAX3BFD8_9SPIR|nr:hypothetical protein [Thermospira aquatica]URA10853.1 hypothetical protein KDW03_03340 [Thermospira aquatica]